MRRAGSVKARGRYRTALVGLGLGAALILGAVSAQGEIIQAGGIDLRVDAQVKPKRLPPRRSVPVSLATSAKISRSDSLPAPGLRRAVVDFDVQGDVDTRGLGRCRVSAIDFLRPAAAKRRCRSALVGSGSAKAALSEELTVRGPILIFNGRVPGARKSVLIYSYLPSSGGGETIVAVGKIKKAPGSVYGRRVVLEVPEFAEGDGRLTGLSARVDRRWRHRGKERSFTVARCYAGNFVFRGDLTFTDGTNAQGSLIRGCRPKRR